jgi:hypothetical protein
MRIIVAQNFAVIINLSHINLRNHHKFKDYLSIQFNESNTKLWFNNKYVEKNSRFKSLYTSFSKDNDIVIKFTSTELFDPNDGKGFELIITSSEHKPPNRNCPKFLFDCENNLCIKNKFRCNGINNCGNNRDEKNCKRSHNNNYLDIFDTGFWFGFKIVVSLLLIGIFLGIISCICKSCDDRKKNNEILYSGINRYPGCSVENAPIFASIYSKKQIKTPLYPKLYRNYGGTEYY